MLKTSTLLSLFAALALLLSGMFDFVRWEFTGYSSGELIFGLYRLDWVPSGQLQAASSQENMALAYLNYGIVALIIGMLSLRQHALLQQKIKRAVLLLSGALLFAIITTAFRAANSLQMELQAWRIGTSLYLSALAFGLLLFVFLRDKSNQESNF